MSKYLVTYDIQNGDADNYNAINSKIENSFPNNCKILTTSYVFSANNADLSGLREKMEKATTKKVRSIIVSISGYSWRLEDADCVKKYLP